MGGAGAGRDLSAQRVVISGRVLYGGPPPGGRPVARTWVVLHRVTMGGGGGPVDSTRTDGRGAFHLAITPADTSAIYVVSSWYSGLAYFSEPLTAPHPTVELRPLLVYDTTSRGSEIQVARRLVTVAKAKPDGTRDALELVELVNPGAKTRIAADTTQPTWSGAVPREAIQFQVGQGDLSAQAVALRGDRVAVFGPIPPGDPKQLSYAYVLPAGVERLALPIDQATAELDLLLEDTAAVVTAAPLDTLGVQSLEGRRFARYRARPVPAAAGVTVAFADRRGLRAEQLVPYVVAGAALVLGAGFVMALRRKTPSAVSHQPSATADSR